MYCLEEEDNFHYSFFVSLRFTSGKSADASSFTENTIVEAMLEREDN